MISRVRIESVKLFHHFKYVFRQAQGNSLGNAMISVLMAGTVLAIITTAFLSMFNNQIKTSRNIAARGGVTDLNNGIDILFESPQCNSTGSFLNGGAAANVIIGGSCTAAAGYCLSVDTIKFASGTVVLTSDTTSSDYAGIKQLIQPYSISGITLNALGGEGSSGSSFKYPFRMEVQFTNNNGGFPPAPLIKFISVYTSAGTSSSKPVIGFCSTPTGPPGTNIISGEMASTDTVTCADIHSNNPMKLVFTQNIVNSGSYYDSLTGDFTPSKGLWLLTASITVQDTTNPVQGHVWIYVKNDTTGNTLQAGNDARMPASLGLYGIGSTVTSILDANGTDKFHVGVRYTNCAVDSKVYTSAAINKPRSGFQLVQLR